MLETILLALSLVGAPQAGTPPARPAARDLRVDDDRDDDDVDIEGRVEALDRANRTFRLRGLLVSYADTSFDDGRRADLRNGVRVEVDGRLIRGGRVLRAQEIEFEDD